MTRNNASRVRSGGWVPGGGLRAGIALMACAPAVAAIWLFLAAIPALADGGPHVSTINNGSLGINADGCAGCHRAHTAQGPFLLNSADEEALCLTCHGAAGTGSTVDVMTGIQYALGGDGLRDTGTMLGALRNGGFDQARIGEAGRFGYLVGSQRQFLAKVIVAAAPGDVTSAHLALPDNGLTMPGIAWGNGANGSGAGPAVTLSCATCHNPHGNGQYRILNPIPEASGAGFTPAAAAAAVTDAPLPPPGDTRNYTVIQIRGTEGTDSSYLLYASQVTSGGYAATSGDYFHRFVPWNQTSATLRSNDAPNGRPSTFNTEITAWCSACHTRYYSVAADTPRLDAIYAYQHETVSNRACTTCHVSHGSNVAMAGTYSSTFTYPDGTVSASSRLLKIVNRGTCQACHDPTGTAGSAYVGPRPIPGVP